MQLYLSYRQYSKVRVEDKSGMLSSTKLPAQNSQQSSNFELPPSHLTGSNVWLLKVTGYNRGIGIHVFNKLEEF